MQTSNLKMVFQGLGPREEGGQLPYNSDGDTRRLPLVCKLQILVSIRVFGMESHFICPFRYRLILYMEKFTKNVLTLTKHKSPLGVSLSLSHIHTGLPQGFNLNFPTSIPLASPSFGCVPNPAPPPPPLRGLNTLTTGMTWVTPSPESITVPVRVLSPTWRDVQDAAKASTACRKKKGNFLLIDLYLISLDRDANVRLGLYPNESRHLWICIFFTPIIMNRALNCSREQFQINAVSVSRFNRFVWTEGRFVWNSVQF